MCNENMNMEDDLHFSIAVANVSTKANGGYYLNGTTKPLVEKLNVATKWIEMNNDFVNKEKCASIRALAKAAKVSRDFGDIRAIIS